MRGTTERGMNGEKMVDIHIDSWNAFDRML